MKDNKLTAILNIQYNSIEELEESARKYSECPHVIFWGKKNSDAYLLLRLPESKRLWAEYICENPKKTFGGVSANLLSIDRVYKDCSITVFPSKLREISPCGSNCAKCPAYGECIGCPSTVHYIEKDAFDK